jgi:hypothetical protein
MKQHLAHYKRDRLGVSEMGIWKTNGKRYAHILPEELKRLNIIETIRSEFWAYRADSRGLSLHRDFHHLGSSQAMCFNLFFPLFGLTGSDPRWLTGSLHLGESGIADWGFERRLDAKERTSFDFLMKMRSGPLCLFETKLTESGFGQAKDDTRHRMKLDGFYKGKLKNKVRLETLEKALFLSHYQLLRNVAYADASRQVRVFFVVPRKNEALTPSLEFLKKALAPGMETVVTVVWLEDLIGNIIGALGERALLAHFELFKEKYIL